MGKRPVAEAQALLKLIFKKGGIMQVQKRQRSESLGLVSSSFKVIVLLLQTKVPPSCKSESSAHARLLLTGEANCQT